MSLDARTTAPGRVLVWGACGFIGRHLVPALLSRGHRVSVLTHRRARYVLPSWAEAVVWHELPDEGGSPRVLAEAVAEADVIYDLAGSTGAVESNRHPLDSLRRNNVALLDVLEAVRHEGRRPRVVFASSRLVYGKPTGLPVDENHPLAPESIYAAHKLCCEHYLRVFAAQGMLSFTIARISNVYGPDVSRPARPHGRINGFVRQALTGVPIRLFGHGQQLRDQMYVSDAAEVLASCGSEPAAANQVFNVGTGIGVSLREVADRVTALAGGPAVEFVPWPADFAVVETGDYISDPSKLRRILGIVPRWGIQQGLDATVAACRAEMQGRSPARDLAASMPPLPPS